MMSNVPKVLTEAESEVKSAKCIAIQDDYNPLNYWFKSWSRPSVFSMSTNIPEHKREPENPTLNIDNALIFADGVRYYPTVDKVLEASDYIFITNKKVFPFEFDPEATCPTWLKFVDDVFNDDVYSGDLLQEWFGYNLLPDTNLQSFLYMFGAPGSGKSTVTDVLTAMLGIHHVCATSIDTFTNTHGSAALAGKKAAILSEDVPGDRRQAEKLLSVVKTITGQDTVNINPKFKTPYSAKLMCKLTFVANELPRFEDEAQALKRRMNFLYFPNEYYKAPRHPDVNLRQKLLKELPGIFNWAVCGWIDLQEAVRNPNDHIKGGSHRNFNGFTEPPISRQHLDEYEKLASPLKAMIDEYCTFDDAQATISVDTLYELYKAVFTKQGLKYDNARWFGRKFKSAFPGLERRRPGNRENRTYVYCGLKLNEAAKEILSNK